MTHPTAPQATPSVNARPYDAVKPQKVAFLGLGVMGYPMAGHLALAGHRVTVYNRNPAKAAAWLKEFGHTATEGAMHQIATTPKEAAQDADVVFCCVGNDNDLRAVVLGQGDH